MRRILLILLLLLCGLTPAQKKVLLQGSQDYEQLIRQHQPTLWLDGGDVTKITATDTKVSAWASKVGAVSFTQATGENQPSLTRYDNRENRILHSEDVSQAGAGKWTYVNAVNISATEFRENAVNDVHAIRNVTQVTEAGTYRFGCMIKRGTGSRNALIRLVGGGSPTTVINLATGAVLFSSGYTSITVTPVSDYYSVSILATLTAASIYFEVRMADGTNSSYAGDDASSLHVTEVFLRPSLASSTYLATTTYPQYRGINGRSAVRFDGAASKMTSAATLADIMAAGAVTFFLVTKPYDVSNAGQQNILIDSSTRFALYSGAGASTFQYYNYDGNHDNTIAQAFTNNKITVFSGRHEGGNIYLSQNNGADYSAASGDTDALTGTLIMAKTGAFAYYNGDIAEIIFFNKVLPSDVRIKIQKGLCKKWGASC